MANFQTALDALKSGRRVARKPWKSGFLFLACGLDFFTEANLCNVYTTTGGECDGVNPPTYHYDCGPATERKAICFCPKNKRYGSITVGWLPKFDDLFAEDWYVVNDEPRTFKREDEEYNDKCEDEVEEQENVLPKDVKVASANNVLVTDQTILEILNNFVNLFKIS